VEEYRTYDRLGKEICRLISRGFDDSCESTRLPPFNLSRNASEHKRKEIFKLFSLQLEGEHPGKSPDSLRQGRKLLAEKSSSTVFCNVFSLRMKETMSVGLSGRTGSSKKGQDPQKADLIRLNA
jgi:hypothetical protein